MYSSRSYHVAHETFIESGRAIDYRIGGRYLDTFRHIDGRWLIQHRDIVYDWSRVMSGNRAGMESREAADAADRPARPWTILPIC